ncbi:MAG TPA: hypothetical protein VES67_18105 [Vicinamibacterales bacterium]|nr:hypothetical protein [Vicinamibacterales bacterium]
MNDRPQPGQPKAAEGLCPSCRYVKVVTNDRGSRFIFCERSRTDPSFPRYPRLPVLVCSGYEPAEATAGGPPGYDTSSDAPH